MARCSQAPALDPSSRLQTMPAKANARRPSSKLKAHLMNLAIQAAELVRCRENIRSQDFSCCLPCLSLAAPWLISTIDRRARLAKALQRTRRSNAESDQRFPRAVPCCVAFAHSGDRYCRTVACGFTDRRDYVRYIGHPGLSGEDRQKQRDMGKRHRCSAREGPLVLSWHGP